jgi:hypothetical protein
MSAIGITQEKPTFPNSGRVHQGGGSHLFLGGRLYNAAARRFIF